MKNHLSFFLILALTGISLTSCRENCRNLQTYYRYTPVYMSYDEFRNSVASESPRDIVNPGKIFISGNMLFVSETGIGVHVIDNANPSNPVNKAFIKIIGNHDIAIKGNYLYADSHQDLVVIDLANLDNVQEVGRLQDLFPNTLDPIMAYADPNLGVVKEWVVEEVTEELACDRWNNGTGIWMEDNMVFSNNAQLLSTSFESSGSRSDASGMGGSMARFSINGYILYAVDNFNLNVVDISNPSGPGILNSLSMGNDLETLFPYKNKLFIGSSSGMHIYSLDDPAAPVYLSTYSHVFACDPVVVDDHYAYVTLREGTQCTNQTNQLEVVDISNPYSPVQVKVYPMENPHGLGIDGSTLFVCDGDAGLKIYDASDVHAIDAHQLHHYSGINAYDVIPYQNHLIMSARNGIYQYDYSNPDEISLLSIISKMTI